MKSDSAYPSDPRLHDGKGGPAAGARASPTEGDRTVDSDERNVSVRALAHDMRNAVAPIRNVVQLLKLRAGADANLAPLTDIIDRQVDEIVRLVNILSDADRRGRDELKPAGEGDGMQSAAGPAISRRILIVDDNAALLTSLSAVLREAGHDVKTAGDGLEALALAQNWKPEFVLLDVHMPRMTGFEVAKQLRALFARGEMKLVLMSGSSLDATTLRGAEKAGFDHCIDKIHEFAALEKLLRW
jgi:CheY-like chemotaxis protein